MRVPLARDPIGTATAKPAELRQDVPWAPSSSDEALRPLILAISALVVFVTWLFAVMVVLAVYAAALGQLPSDIPMWMVGLGLLYPIASYVLAWAWMRYQWLRAVPLAIAVALFGPPLLVMFGITVALPLGGFLNDDASPLGFLERTPRWVAAIVGAVLVFAVPGTLSAGDMAPSTSRWFITAFAALALPFSVLYRVALTGGGEFATTRARLDRIIAFSAGLLAGAIAQGVLFP